MAKIQNPQDQNGINLVNQETFETDTTHLNERIEKVNQPSFPANYANFNDSPCYVTAYGFEYVNLTEDTWIQNIEVSVALQELRDSSVEYNPSLGSLAITPNIIGEKVCKMLVAEGLSDNWGPSFNIAIDEITLGISKYNICEKDKNNALSETLNFTFAQPIFLKANKNYRFYFYDQNENLYALPIIINVDDSNNITTNKKEVASRCLIDRYDYSGVWGIKGIIPEPYGPYGLKVKLSKGVYSPLIAHNSNDDIHITGEERNKWNKTDEILSDISHITYSNEGYSNDNYALAGGFKLNLIQGGYLENIKVWCHTGKGDANETYLKILDSNNNPVACSENIQSHGMGKILSFNFNNFFVNDNTTYKCIFATTNRLDTPDLISSCITLCNNNKDNAVCPLKAELLDGSYNVIGDNLQAIISYTIKGKVRTLIPDTILIPESENTNITDEGGTLRFKFAKNIDNIAVVSYAAHISNELESSITVDTKQINININKKEATPSGEYYIVIELLYIDKIYKSVKRAYAYSKVTI